MLQPNPETEQTPGAPVDVPLSIYVHIPWCISLCPYCDFNTYAIRQTPFDAHHYIQALLADAAFEQRWSLPRTIRSIFIGGGTPSLLPPPALARLLQGLRCLWSFDPQIEITMEANPGDVNLERLRAWHQTGVNRLSLGIQSFNPEVLRRLGRRHDEKQAIAAIELAHQAGFNRINVDLMFGVPGQNPDMVETDIGMALKLESGHVSHYQLSIEPDTPFGRKPPRLPGEDAQWDMYRCTEHQLEKAGYDHYEVSAYALPGHQCRHNLNYWQYGDYIGLGAGAYGKLTGLTNILRYRKRLLPHDYMHHAGNWHSLIEWEQVYKSQRPLDFMLNALRLRDGIDKKLLRRSGIGEELFLPALQEGTRRGWFQETAHSIKPTRQGWLHLNEALLLFAP